MRHESLLNVLFLFGSVWRGPRFSSWIVLVALYMAFDATMSTLYAGSSFESVERTLAMIIGMAVGLTIHLFLSVATRRPSPPILAPGLAIIVATLVGELFIPSSVEGGLIVLGLAARLMAVMMMVQGAWGPDLIYICTGTLFVTPLLNLIFQDMSDAAGWDGSWGINWIVLTYTEAIAYTAVELGLKGMAETAVVAATIFVAGMISLPVIFVTWNTQLDLESSMTATAATGKKPVPQGFKATSTNIFPSVAKQNPSGINTSKFDAFLSKASSWPNKKQ